MRDWAGAQHSNILREEKERGAAELCACSLDRKGDVQEGL